MDGASGIIAVIALGIQLTDSINKARNCLSHIKHGPVEFVALSGTLHNLSVIIKQVNILIRQQDSLGLLENQDSDYLSIVGDAMRACEADVNSLWDLVKKFQKSLERAQGLNKTWAAMRVSFRREDVHRLQVKMNQNLSALQMIISVQCNHIQ